MLFSIFLNDVGDRHNFDLNISIIQLKTNEYSACWSLFGSNDVTHKMANCLRFRNIKQNAFLSFNSKSYQKYIIEIKLENVFNHP